LLLLPVVNKKTLHFPVERFWFDGSEIYCCPNTKTPQGNREGVVVRVVVMVLKNMLGRFISLWRVKVKGEFLSTICERVL